MSDADAGSTSPSTPGRSSPTESSSLLAAPQPSSTAMAAEYSRNMQRLAVRSRLNCTTQYNNNNNNNLICIAPVCAKKTSVALADRTNYCD